jgi:hypothetical protein
MSSWDGSALSRESRPDGERSESVPIDVPEDDETACPECGGPVSPPHECERDEVLDYRLLLDRQDEVTLSDEVTAYLASPQGQFELWYAERERRRGARS